LYLSVIFCEFLHFCQQFCQQNFPFFHTKVQCNKNWLKCWYNNRYENCQQNYCWQFSYIILNFIFPFQNHQKLRDYFYWLNYKIII
jgi:hypothetical protein